MERVHMQDLGVGRRNNIKIVLKEVGYGLNCSGSIQGGVRSASEFGNEHSGSVKFGEFLDSLRNC